MLSSGACSNFFFKFIDDSSTFFSLNNTMRLRDSCLVSVLSNSFLLMENGVCHCVIAAGSSSLLQTLYTCFPGRLLLEGLSQLLAEEAIIVNDAFTVFLDV